MSVLKEQERTQYEHAEHIADTIGRTIRPYAVRNGLSAQLLLDALGMAGIALCSTQEEPQKLFSEWLAVLLEVEERQILDEEERCD